MVKLKKRDCMITSKLKIFVIFLSLILLVLFQAYYNSKQIYFSHKSGFYDNQFFLKIKTGKNYKIFYTLDSSVPTVNSIPYSKPILIKDASSNPNVLSARSDMTFQHYFDNKIQKIPNSPVDKAVIVRAALFDQNNNLLNQDYRVFFVGFNKKNGYKNLPVVSVIMNPDDIIDGKRGIFVLGNKKSQKIESCSQDTDETINFCKKSTNLEKKALIDIFSSNNRTLYFSHKAGIKIKGAESRELIQKSMSLYAREQYDNSPYFSKNIFDNKIKLHNIILFNGGNDIHAKIKDYIVQTTESKINSHFSTLKMIPCSVFLNGEYWGVYYLSENHNIQYFHTKYNIDKDELLITRKNNTSITKDYPPGIYELFAFYDKQMNVSAEVPIYVFFNNLDMSNDKNYQKACKLIDIDSFIDYYATEIYIANSDWPKHNNARWKTTYKDKNNNMADTKWRWILFDVNSPEALIDYKYDSIGKTIETCPIFNALIKNKSFKEKFIQRIRFLESQVYTPENMNLLIDDWLSIMKDPVFKSNERFLHENANFIFDKEINNIRKFFELRPQYINLYIDKHLGRE